MSSTKSIPEALQKALQKGSLERAFSVQRQAIDEAARTATLAFASELPYERYFGMEILDCTATAMRTGRLRSGANLLCDHEARDVVGVVESVEIGADRVGRAVVRFGKSARAEEVWQDVLGGIRRNVSVGYMIHKAVLVEENDGLETYRITDWEPFEISLVSVPADASVGVGRSASEISISVNVTTTEDDAAEEDATEPAEIVDGMTNQAASLTPSTQEEKTMTAPAIEVVAQRNHAAEISNLAKTIVGDFVPDLALKSIQSGHTLEQFQGEVLRAMSNKPLPTADIGMTKKEASRYSVLRAIRAMADRDWKDAGLEREAHTTILKRAGLSEAPNNGFYVPYEVQKRDLTATTGSQGGFLVATNNLGDSFIDLLRNRATVAQAGATMLSGLQGNVTIPKQTGANTAYWLSNEATAITEGNAVFGQLALSPKNVGAYQEVSRQLMLQSSPSADALVMNDLAKVLALAVDIAAFEGTGASGQPTGIANTAGIGSVTGTSIAYAQILQFQTQVAAANALAGNCAYITTPAIAALLLQRQRFTSTDSPLWQGNVLDGNVSGFKAMSTLQLTAASMIFGDFSQVIVADWGMLEIALNPYANFQAAITGIRAIQTVDVGVRITGAFSRSTSIT